MACDHTWDSCVVEKNENGRIYQYYKKICVHCKEVEELIPPKKEPVSLEDEYPIE